MALLSRPVGSGKFAAFTHWTCLRFSFLNLFVVGTKSAASLSLSFVHRSGSPTYSESGCVSTQELGVSFFCYRGGSGIKNGWKGWRWVIGRLKYRTTRINCERDKSVACQDYVVD